MIFPLKPESNLVMLIVLMYVGEFDVISEKILFVFQSGATGEMLVRVEQLFFENFVIPSL